MKQLEIVIHLRTQRRILLHVLVNINIFLIALQPCYGNEASRMSCTAPPIELSNSSNTFRIGLLMDAACQLLTLTTTIRVHSDPYFEPFENPVIFDETESLDSSLDIFIEVRLVNHQTYDCT